MEVFGICSSYLLVGRRNIFSWAVSELQPVDPTNRKAINLGAFLGEILGTLCIELGCQFCLCFLVGGFCVCTCLWSKLIKQHFHEHPFETVDFTSRDDHFCSFTISKASSERPNPYLILRTSNSPPPCKSKSSSTYHVLSTGKVKLVPIFGDIWTYLASLLLHPAFEFGI